MYPIHAYFALERVRRGKKVDETAEAVAERKASEPRPPGSDVEVNETVETTEPVP